MTFQLAAQDDDKWRGVYYFQGWNDAEFWPWFAAFIDGEGTIYLPRKTGIVLSIANTDRDVIESIRHRVGVGYVEVVTFDNPRWKPKYTWRIARYNDIRKVLLHISPYLTIKSRAGNAAIARIAASVQAQQGRDARYAAILAAVKGGRTHADVAGEFGLSRSAVSALIAQPKRKPRLRPARIGTRHYRSSGKKLPTRLVTRSRRLS